jgi:hypothetical protein
VKPTYWLSPFRHRTVWAEALDPDGKPKGFRVPHEMFVANVAPSRAMKRQSVEIALPAALMRTLSKPKRDHILKKRITEALATFTTPAT